MFSLFHSFPRGAATESQELDLGLNVLNSFLERGLLLLPERITFPGTVKDGAIVDAGSAIVQLRACFTLLQVGELCEHSAAFGSFAIEFDLESLRPLGCMPVIYVPQPVANSRGTPDYSIIGNTLVHQVRDIAGLIKQLVELESAVRLARTDGRSVVEIPEVDVSVDLDTVHYLLQHLLGDRISFRNLYNYSELLASMFYHVDSARSEVRMQDADLHYYKQREWRVLGGMSVNGKSLDSPLSEAESALLVKLNPRLQKQVTVRGNRTIPKIALATVVRQANDRPLWRLAKHIYVPDCVAVDAKALFRRYGVADELIQFVPYERVRSLRQEGRTPARPGHVK